MKYYVTSDTHGFYSLLVDKLKECGWYEDSQPHKLIICGDLMDRGEEAVKMQEFISELLKKDEVILIKGNHEWLYESLVTTDEGIAYNYHVSNGTFGTLLQLTGHKDFDTHRERALAGQKTNFYLQIIPSCVNYFETEHYIFTHGWIPKGKDWRKEPDSIWRRVASWQNGMAEYKNDKDYFADGKTVVCGHFHTSWVRHKAGLCSEFGPDADFSTFRDDGIIALDACTAYTGIMNMIVLDD